MRFTILTVLAIVYVTHISATDDILIYGAVDPIDSLEGVRDEIDDVLLQISEVHNVTYVLDMVVYAQFDQILDKYFAGEVQLEEGAEKKKCKFYIISRETDRYRWGKISCDPEFKELVVVRGPTKT